MHLLQEMIIQSLLFLSRHKSSDTQLDTAKLSSVVLRNYISEQKIILHYWYYLIQGAAVTNERVGNESRYTKWHSAGYITFLSK